MPAISGAQVDVDQIRGKGWSGTRRIDAPGDVERLLAEISPGGRRTVIEAVAALARATEVTPAQLDATRMLPVVDELRELLPWHGLRRGATVGVVGSGSLLMTILGGAMSQGAWAAVVGMPQLGMCAAVEYAVDLPRLALVPQPGPDWATVVAALIDGVDVVVVGTPGEVSAALARRLIARARQRGCVLVTTTPWPGADLTLRVTEHVWRGLERGRGRLLRHEVRVEAVGRGSVSRSRQAVLALPPASLAAVAGRQPGDLPANVVERVLARRGGAQTPVTPRGQRRLAPVASTSQPAPPGGAQAECEDVA